MKNKFNLIFLVLMVITIVNSCQKEILTDNIDNTKQTENDFKVEQQIQNFIMSVENPLKSEKYVDIDSLVWYTEAALNYSYAFVEEACEEISVDSLKLLIEVKDEKEVKFSDMIHAYQDMKKFLKEGFEGSQNSQKHLLLVDVSLMKASQTTTNMREIMVKFVKAYSYPNFLWNFGPNDYWKYGFGQGKCDGTYLGLDAAKKIQGRINLSLIQKVGTYYTDVEFVEVYGDEFINPNDETNWDNMYDYMMFYNYTGDPNFHECLEPAEMNFYLNGTKSVLYTFAPNGKRPIGKAPILISLWGDLIGTIPDYPIMHNGSFKYGIKHYNSGPKSKNLF